MATPSNRRVFKHDGALPRPYSLLKLRLTRIPVTGAGRIIYEWEQSMEEVNVYIKPPPGVTAQQIQCDIAANHVTLGLRGVTDKFLNVRAVGSNFYCDNLTWKSLTLFVSARPRELRGSCGELLDVG
ncbi:unnamed protein product [Phytophthora fragariaefolia]|uniref:Unnamed protein product n=1 Tax=Phytophthora fragariaefolia TaxID=1490495 RepID=A0A9W6XHV8_9STRA|nr:unnamed protein product [Phytophthora fragariaefolia]